MVHFPDKILFIDDSTFFHEMLQSFFEETGQSIELRCADSVDKAEKTLETFMPSVILLDMKMPGKDGVDMLEFLSASDRLNTIPVIIATAVEKIEMQEKYGRVNVIGVLHKPFEKEPFLERVKSIWGAYDTEAE